MGPDAVEVRVTVLVGLAVVPMGVVAAVEGVEEPAPPATELVGLVPAGGVVGSAVGCCAVFQVAVVAHAVVATAGDGKR